MEEEKQQENTNKDFQDSSDNSSFTSEENPLDTTSQIINPENKSGQQANKDCYVHPNIIINNPTKEDLAALEIAREANQISRDSNKIGKVGLIASIIAAAFTLGALYFSWSANQTTQDALTDAREKDIRSEARERRLDSLNYTRDSTNIALTRQSLITQETTMKSSDSINKQTIELAKQSLEAQINAIKQTQKDFELESRAFLQVRSIKVDTVAMDKPFTINFSIGDIGKFPANITSTKFGLTYGGDPTPKQVRDALDKANVWQINNADEVVSPTTEIRLIQPAVAFTTSQWEKFKQGKFSIYFAMELRYISLGIEKKYIMKLIVRLTRTPDINQIDIQTIDYSDTEIQ